MCFMFFLFCFSTNVMFIPSCILVSCDLNLKNANTCHLVSGRPQPKVYRLLCSGFSGHTSRKNCEFSHRVTRKHRRTVTNKPRWRFISKMYIWRSWNVKNKVKILRKVKIQSVEKSWNFEKRVKIFVTKVNVNETDISKLKSQYCHF